MLETLLRHAAQGDVVADAPWLLVLLYKPMLCLAEDTKTLGTKTRYVQALFSCIMEPFLDAELNDSFRGDFY